MIKNPKDISNIFNMFNDGLIEEVEKEDKSYRLNVKLPFLDKRTQKEFKYYTVVLHGLRNFEFLTGCQPKEEEIEKFNRLLDESPNAAADALEHTAEKLKKWNIKSLEEIFAPELKIGGLEIGTADMLDKEKIEVIFGSAFPKDRSSPHYDYDGAILIFQCDSAQVFAES